MSKRKITPLSPKDQVYARELIEEFEGTIRRTVYSYLGPDLSFEFDDIVQSVYESICTQLDDFRTCDSLEALVVVIATRAVWRVRRDHKVTEVLTEDIPATETDPGLKEILPSSTLAMDREVLTSAYERLDTMVELASDLGRSPSTLRQQLKRAKMRLKKALEESTSKFS